MVLNTIIALGAGFILLSFVATIIRFVGFGGTVTFLAQTAATIVFGYALLSVGFVGLPVAIALVILPFALRIFAYLWFYWQAKRVLDGKYGKQAKWAAELVESGDDEFLEASAELSQLDLREVGILSETKEELRENTIEQAEENDAN